MVATTAIWTTVAAGVAGGRRRGYRRGAVRSQVRVDRGLPRASQVHLRLLGRDGPGAEPAPDARGDPAPPAQHHPSPQAAANRHRRGGRSGLAQLRHPEGAAVLGLPEPGRDVHRRQVPQLHRLRPRGHRGFEHAGVQRDRGSAGVVLRVLSRAHHLVVELVPAPAHRAGRSRSSTSPCRCGTGSTTT